jgi:hypothetical protein
MYNSGPRSFSTSHDLAPSTAPPPSEVVSLSQSSCKSPVKLTYGRRGEGRGEELNHTTARKPVLFRPLTTLCNILWSISYDESRCLPGKRRVSDKGSKILINSNSTGPGIGRGGLALRSKQNTLHALRNREPCWWQIMWGSLVPPFLVILTTFASSFYIPASIVLPRGCLVAASLGSITMHSAFSYTSQYSVYTW